MSDNQTRRGIYERMYRILTVDTTMRGLMMKGTISIIYYSPRGQEAIPSAVSAALTQGDYITTTYRGLHDTLAKGAPVREVIAEIIGRSGGTCKGKGGIMHLSDPRCGVMATSGIVGGSVPIANGLALRAQMTGSDAVTVAYFGDGATNIGAFHESLNMAAVWRLPVVFVCQNNEYGEFTPRMESMTVKRIAVRADAYAIPGVTVDGNDPDAVYEAASAAVARARAGEGPTLIEANTYRFMGHIFGVDQMEYMPKEEMQAALANDPVPAYRARLVAEGIATEDELAALEAEVKAEVTDAVEFALASPPPDPAETYTDVYAEAVPA
ncbi:MAG TPA: thiamine pyrophosphate-dependent dehydrogenase E1 component subunit alpha [Pseudonocardia sp.]|uniref:thiamine pyrophosphate-dependent dehydrogenase E1 component subunit alpha n=1 Tax=Pseudonocardia sp. TaxID=60912 RepID=UPI002BC70837|nr:thiamine pyrophosphate-dependent dehydrogenase E1 component subunit alpha [Pseudonocardia sp.]HTF54729.1 thiamine pyrophosphate-dependent dehydrogenase E1 component subunit alpha [Pseudonocardia sp.]